MLPPYSASLIAAMDEAMSGREILCRIFQVVISVSGRLLIYVYNISSALHVREFPKQELFGYVLVQHTDDMT